MTHFSKPLALVSDSAQLNRPQFLNSKLRNVTIACILFLDWGLYHE
jgi:hypothetical protein